MSTESWPQQLICRKSHQHTTMMAVHSCNDPVLRNLPNYVPVNWNSHPGGVQTGGVTHGLRLSK